MEYFSFSTLIKWALWCTGYWWERPLANWHPRCQDWETHSQSKWPLSTQWQNRKAKQVLWSKWANWECLDFTLPNCVWTRRHKWKWRSTSQRQSSQSRTLNEATKVYRRRWDPIQRKCTTVFQQGHPNYPCTLLNPTRAPRKVRRRKKWWRR